MTTSISSEAFEKKPRKLKSRFPLNLTDRQTERKTYGWTDIIIYRVASLLIKAMYDNMSKE